MFENCYEKFDYGYYNGWSCISYKSFHVDFILTPKFTGYGLQSILSNGFFFKM